MKLRKVRARASSYLSAQWEVEGLPELIVRRSWDMRQSPPPVVWEVGLVYNPERSEDSCDPRTLRVHQALKDQKFRTRTETLQAVRIFLDTEG